MPGEGHLRMTGGGAPQNDGGGGIPRMTEEGRLRITGEGRASECRGRIVIPNPIIVIPNPSIVIPNGVRKLTSADGDDPFIAKSGQLRDTHHVR